MSLYRYADKKNEVPTKINYFHVVFSRRVINIIQLGIITTGTIDQKFYMCR